MTDAEHPIDTLDERPEGDAVEQQRSAADPAPAPTDVTPGTAIEADAAEQRDTRG
jgi:hypothetical protein